MDGHIWIEERVTDSCGLWQDLWIKNLLKSHLEHYNFMTLLRGEII